MVTVEIGPGERVMVKLRDTDGEFTVKYGETRVTVHADLPDDKNREGIIYSEKFNHEDEDVTVCGAVVRPNPLNVKGITSCCILPLNHSEDCRDSEGNKRKHGARSSKKCRIKNPHSVYHVYCKRPFCHEGEHQSKTGETWK